MAAVKAQPLNRHVAHLLADIGIAAHTTAQGRKQIGLMACDGVQLLQQCQRPIGQRYQKVIAHLHIFIGHKPNAPLKIDIVPTALTQGAFTRCQQRIEQQQIAGYRVNIRAGLQGVEKGRQLRRR